MAITKEFMDLSPDHYFKNVYQSKIDMTEEVVTIYEPIDMSYGSYINQVHVQMKTEKVVAIKMPTSEYTKFMYDYQNYLDILQYRKNPVVNDMLDKLNTYIKLLK